MSILTTTFKQVKKSRISHIPSQIIRIIMLFCIAFIFSSLIAIITSCTIPIYVLNTNNMSPNYNRGDLLILVNSTNININDVVLFKQQTYVISRVKQIQHDKSNNNIKIKTKSDSYSIDDRFIYLNKEYLLRKHIIGKVIMKIPKAGMLTILFCDFIVFKIATILLVFVGFMMFRRHV